MSNTHSFKVGDYVKMKPGIPPTEGYTAGVHYSVEELDADGNARLHRPAHEDSWFSPYELEPVAPVTPKVGDTIRATRGESVLVGKVTYARDAPYIDVLLEGIPSVTIDGKWSIEIIKPKVTLPTKFASLIKLGDVLYTRAASEWFTSSGRKYEDVEIQRRVHSGAYGELVVLYEGEDA